MYLDYQMAQERLRARLASLHNLAPNSIGDLLHMELTGFSPEDGGVFMTCDTYSWMSNPIGLLHGGIISTIFDQGMGMLAHCLIPEDGFAPSIQLNVSFIRPMQTEKKILLKVYVDSATKTLIHMHAEGYELEAPQRLCANANGIYYYKPQK